MKKHLSENKDNKNEIEEFVKKIEKLREDGLKTMPAEEIVTIGKKIGKILKDKQVTTTQIRKFLDAVRRIQVKDLKNFQKDEIIMLKPKLAYTVGRQKREVFTALQSLMQVLDPAIDATKDLESFKKLVLLIEAIVAYHRYYGGRDN